MMKVFYYTTILVGLAQMLTNVEATAGSIRSNRKLQLQLVGYGGRPAADRFPLQLCIVAFALGTLCAILFCLIRGCVVILISFFRIVCTSKCVV